MSDNNKETNTNGIMIDDSMGNVSFADEVISIIAGLAASEIPGVAGMTGNWTTGIQEILGVKNLSKGVKVEVGKEQAAIDVFCIINYGASIIDVARSIQENVKKEVENMTGLNVVECNVHVQGIHFEKEAPPAPPVSEPEPPRVR